MNGLRDSDSVVDRCALSLRSVDSAQRALGPLGDEAAALKVSYEVVLRVEDSRIRWPAHSLFWAVAVVSDDHEQSARSHVLARHPHGQPPSSHVGRGQPLARARGLA